MVLQERRPQLPLNIHTKLPVCSNEAFLWTDGRVYVIELLNPARKSTCTPQEREFIQNTPLHFKLSGNEGVHGLKLLKVAEASTPKRTVQQGGRAIEVFVGRLSPYLFACHVYLYLSIYLFISTGMVRPSPKDNKIQVLSKFRQFETGQGFLDEHWVEADKDFAMQMLSNANGRAEKRGAKCAVLLTADDVTTMAKATPGTPYLIGT